MSIQDPNYNPDTGTNRNDNSGIGKNKTVVILASALAIIAVIAVILLGWNYANQDSVDTPQSSTVTLTSTESPTQTDTATVTSPTPGTVTITSTVDTPSEPTPVTDPTEPPGTAPADSTVVPANACEPAMFQQAGHDFVDTVMFCDDGWARGGLFQTDYVRNFHWQDGAWTMYPASGESPSSGYPCYDTQAMADAGAPSLMLMEVADCAFSN